MINLYDQHANPPSLYGWGIPYVKSTNTRIEHFLNGRLHKEDGPAIVVAGGPRGTHNGWYQHGIYHRVGGPAVDTPEVKRWIIRGVRHREDGPAVEFFKDGNRIGAEWYRHGKMHNTSGPAFIQRRRSGHPGDTEEWHINGHEITSGNTIAIIRQFNEDKDELLAHIQQTEAGARVVSIDLDDHVVFVTRAQQPIPATITVSGGDPFRAAERLGDVQFNGLTYEFKAAL
jgi:hypothetical protein